MLSFKNPGQTEDTKDIKIVLAGDVGATKTNLAIFELIGDRLVSLQEASYPTNDYKSLTELTDQFTKKLAIRPDAVCFGVAGPVLNGHAKLSNIEWEIDRSFLSQHFNTNVQVINDLEANAYGLTTLGSDDFYTLQKVDNPIPGNAAIIAPGTGLGEAGIFWNGKYYQPYATEGGHCDFAARDAFDFDLYLFLQKQFGHVSWERIVSGQGIVNIYTFLRDEKKREEPSSLKEMFMNGVDPAIISREAENNAICNETMALFIRYLGYESANLALKNNATGGLYIGGGISPQIVHLFETFDFLSSFCQSGRMNDLLEKIPVSIVMNNKTALSGAAWYAVHQ